ncbi:MAG: GspH/FimT family pseudopilin [Gammaproteobacteria bacterium]|nr:GspH/FimT family pseudopilin [Gammaproteobacteria bacterium]
MKLNQQHGLTLIELMFTVTIAGIVMAIAVPNLNQFIKNERLTSYTNTLLTDLMLARAESVKRNQSSILCASNNETSCTGGALEDGWIVGSDANNDGDLEAAELIKVQTAIEGDIEFTSTIANNTVIFDSRGFNPDTDGTFTIQDDRGAAHQKTLSINKTGRVSR